jgi:hypothetical protein
VRPETEFSEIDVDHRPELDRAWELIERRVDELPPSVAALAWRFLGTRRPGGSYRDYFSDIQASAPLVYLPLWMREALRRAGQWPEGVAASSSVTGLIAATMWGYFYIRIQDDALDEPADERTREALLFGNVCVHEMARGFMASAHGTPGFHAVFERSWMETTRCTLEERTQLLSDEPYPRERFEAHTGKVAFAEVPLAAVCLRANQGALQPAFSELLRALGVAYGLLNDLRGFARDVRNGHRTYLLARAGWSRSTSPASSEGLVPEALRGRLYEGGLLREFLGEARVELKAAARVAHELGFGPEYARFRVRQERWLADVEQQLLSLSLLRAIHLPG